MSNALPHRRYNPLTGEWIVVSPHRTLRPWQGHEGDEAEKVPPYDENCYLCPRNKRAGDITNPDYEDVFVFENDFPALLKESSQDNQHTELFRSQAVRGTCKVICYGPRHDLALHQMDDEDLQRVIKLWVTESQMLSQTYEWVQIFENRGSLMGASSPHPHGQIWAIDQIPTEASKEAAQQRDYRQRHKSKLLLDYVQEEIEDMERVVYHNDEWVCLVPYWAMWPFETLIVPRFSVSQLHDLSVEHQATLADLYRRVLKQYDALFDAPMSYSMGWHSAPRTSTTQDGWQLHAHIYPPALRSATIPKFMVGFELLAEKQRDITPESAASRLRGENK